VLNDKEGRYNQLLHVKQVMSHLEE